MPEFTYEIVESVAVLSENPKGWTKELNLISWNGRDPKYDIREWAPDHEKMGKGVTLSKDEMEENLGTICKSGSLGFKAQMEKNEDIDIIGQFGVGFYSAFMVAEKIEVYSKAYGENKAYKWTSHGVSGYEIEETEKEKTIQKP